MKYMAKTDSIDIEITSSTSPSNDENIHDISDIFIEISVI